ncbi:MAG: hypothetical protein AB9900_03280 [Humidesulfovibrio sp.]
MLAGEAQAGHKGIFVTAEAFLKVQNPDRNIPPSQPGAQPPEDIDPRHLTVGPFGPSDGRGADRLYITANALDQERVPVLFGPASLVLPSVKDMHGVGGWCYRADKPGDQTTVLLLYGLFGNIDTITVLANVDLVRESSQCAPSTRVHTGLATLSGLKLGLTRAQVRAILGPPLARDSWRDGYKSVTGGSVTPELRRKLHWEDYGATDYGRFQTIAVWFKDDKVIGYEVDEFVIDGPPYGFKPSSKNGKP